MFKQYKAAFLIPVTAKKVLNSSGWLFDTDIRIRPEVFNSLKQAFMLEKKEEYEGIVKYIGDGIKVNLINDKNGLIEHIYIQLITKTAEELNAFLQKEGDNDIELFIPKQ